MKGNFEAQSCYQVPRAFLWYLRIIRLTPCVSTEEWPRSNSMLPKLFVKETCQSLVPHCPTHFSTSVPIDASLLPLMACVCCLLACLGTHKGLMGRLDSALTAHYLFIFRLAALEGRDPTFTYSDGMKRLASLFPGVWGNTVERS